MLPVPRAVAATLALAAVTLLTACDTRASVNRRGHPGTGTASPVAGVQEITLRAPDIDRFEPSTIVVHPGRVRVVLINTGTGAPHNWSLLGFPAAFVPLALKGQTQAATFTAPSPGTYTFVCTIHRNQGQTGKLVVLPH